MKKIQFLTVTIVLVLLLAGCSNIDDYLGNQMLKKSSVLEETNYVVYEQFASEGKLDHEGLYIEATNPIEEEHASIRILLHPYKQFIFRHQQAGCDMQCREICSVQKLVSAGAGNPKEVFQFFHSKNAGQFIIAFIHCVFSFFVFLGRRQMPSA